MSGVCAPGVIAALVGVATVLAASPAIAHAADIVHPAEELTPGNPTPGNPGGGSDATPGNPTPGAPAPAPEPAPAPKYTPQPNYDGPTSIPGPPPVQSVPYIPPTYSTPYTPVLPIVQAPRPRPYVAPLPVVKPPPNTVRIGNLVIPRDKVPLADGDVRSINRWAAYTEAQIATGLVSAGVPRDEATRRAAATVIGVGLGGAIGAGVVGIPATILAEIFFLPIGTVVGATVGGLAAVPIATALAPFLGPAGPAGPAVSVPIGIAAGAGLGAVAGTAAAVAVGVAAAAAGAAVGGTIGGIAAYLLGAGDPGATPGTVRNPGDPEDESVYELPQPNPKADQYHLVFGNLDSKLPGGPGVRYVVKSNGDVQGAVNVNGTKVPFAWSAQSADAPYKALGFFSETARESAKSWAFTTGQDAIKKFGDALHISYPQSVKLGQDAPTDGTLGQAGIDRLKEQQQAQERGARQQRGNATADQAPPPQTYTPPAPAPTPALASIPQVPAAAPEPVRAAVTQAQTVANQAQAGVDQARAALAHTAHRTTTEGGRHRR